MAEAQLFLYLLNAARANPAAYGASIGVDLSNIAPSQPLAFDPILIESSQSYAQQMLNQNFFSNTTPQGSTLKERILASGFSIRNRVHPSKWVQEPIAQDNYVGVGAPPPSSQTVANDVPYTLAQLITDPGVTDVHHRLILLSSGQFSSRFIRLVGIGEAAGSMNSTTTLDTVINIAAPASSGSDLTGVVFEDISGAHAYQVGEGLGNVTIKAVGKHGTAMTTTFDTGGYTLPLHAGTYVVTASGGGLATPVTERVKIGSLNVRFDVVAPT